MRWLKVFLAASGLAAIPALAHGPNVDFYFAPDVPQDLPLVAPPETTALPWGIIRHDVPGPYTSTTVPALPVPFGKKVDALHLMNAGRWLFSVSSPTNLAPYPPGTTALRDDVISWDGSTYDRFFCGSLFGLPRNANIDAVFLEGQRDDGDLVISFSSPTRFGGTTYQPADLVKLQRTGPLCQDWLVGGYFFDSEAEFVNAGVTPRPRKPDVTGADQRGGLTILTFGTPTELGAVTYRPGELVAYDPGPAAFSSFHADPAFWSVSARINAFSLLAAPGRVPSAGAGVQLEVVKAATPGDITITWSAGCSVGAEDYGLYEGSLPALSTAWVYDQAPVTCTDTGTPFTETITPGANDHFYLVVPLNPNDEGSYGLDAPASGSPSERPQGAGTCVATQEFGCP